jgi:hypothetical protein
MRLLFVADGRSPTAQNWLRYWIERGDEVYLASTFPCEADPALKGFELVPVAFSAAARHAPNGDKNPLRGGRTLGLRTRLRHWLGPLTLRHPADHLRAMIERVKPDLVHALRIPFEGMLAARAGGPAPLLVSVWGNDFTLHAAASPLMSRYTARTMKAARGLHCDCQRDVRLARAWGFPQGGPSLVVPGNGGVRTDIFYPPHKGPDMPVVINPRGFRGYIRNEAFFQAIPLVLEKLPKTVFRCAAMAGEAQALDWVDRLGIGRSVELLAPRTHAGMAEVYRTAQVMVSPSVHDGTPNSLLEAMACGCFPVAGRLESIEEWIRDGENGLLVDAARPQALAKAILAALQNPGLRLSAQKQNARLITERAEYRRCMAKAEAFYQEAISG